MTKRFYIFMLLVLGWLGAEAKNEPYAALSNNNKTLTFYYDEYKNSRGGMDLGPFKKGIDRGWNDQSLTITTVVFDKSFAGYKELTSTAYWFCYCDALTTITGIEHLNTANVTDMSYMFEKCHTLTSLDVSHFNTDNVTNMRNMFMDCPDLASLDVSHFNTTNVTDMENMFCGCSSLTSLDVSHFNTTNVTDICDMFRGCSSLTSLDVSNFDIGMVTSMDCMFQGCSSLVTIYGDESWNCANSSKMFSECTALKGAIVYDEEKTDVTYANPTTGYFTPTGKPHPYAALSDDNTTLTFYYDKNKSSRSGMSVGPFRYDTYRGWNGQCSKITKVVIDESFADYKNLTSTAYWFSDCTALGTIIGTEYLNTANVTDMGEMFKGCSSLTSLDVSNFNTAKVTDMWSMFNGCSNLTSLDVRSFNTAKVTNMNTMFYKCSSLTSLDVSSFNTASVNNMGSMFNGCSSLKTIYCDDAWNCSSSGGMFRGCTSLKGAIAYNSIKTDATYANPDTGYFTRLGKYPYAALSDGGATLTFYYDENKTSRGGMDIGPFSSYSNRGWHDRINSIKTVVFDESFADYKQLTSTAYWFHKCSVLKTITGIEHLNTANVTSMYFMFSYCSMLTSLDVSHFNTANVTNMNGMFCGASTLKTIYCSDTWKCDKSVDMFNGCTSLVGAIPYDGSKTDVTYANPETGYFTKPVSPYALLSDDNTTLTFYYDGQKESRGGMDVGPFSDNDGPGWANKRHLITKVVFDESFANCKTLTSTAYWFYNCSALTTITGIEHLNTDNVTSMFYMFCKCSSLTNLDVTHFNTANVENMGSMFLGCSSLTSLDLIDFNTAKVTNMSGMFYGCSSLKTIYCNDTWSCGFSTLMFTDCTSLVGAIAYDSSKKNVSYANPETGYFTKVEACPYAVLSNNNTTLTFYYDKLKIRRAGMDVGPFTYSGEAGWDDQRASIQVVVFDKSLADHEGLTSTAYWFSGCSALGVVKGMEHLNTADVTNMTCMFSECSSLKSLNVTSWKTAKVTDMSYLFYRCSKLGSIKVSYFNTANVEDMSYMFYGCSLLTSLDLKKFSTAKVTNMSDMFFNCSGLKTIYCHSAWKCDYSDDMFRGCTSLKGVIAYDDSKTDATYANPISGYFTGILLGDVNDDGTVDDKDIAAVIRYILEGDSEGFNFAKADMNGDGVINVADIVLINAIKEK